MANPIEIAEAFVTHFYGVFDSNRAQLTGLYRDESMLTFEGQNFLGAQSIVQKLSTLGEIRHAVSQKDVQPTFGGAIIVFVVGQLSIGGGNPLNFSEVFTLNPIPGQAGGFYVHNDIFRLSIV
eukprot:TRINITY_DN8191_c0_g1_i1.p2 TRINITY_DN8191_c0_g1~~TRINITY_DN8191_c0_g1_i1.p2  ORF type:complete len:138 (+),score=64.17 TRINITY_DN8191_c0_g1_i1:48-416(+)